MAWGYLSVIILVGHLATCTVGDQQYAEGIGYVGPSCAVVNGNLYIHGIFVRPLNDSEIIQFDIYQDGLAKLRKYQSSPLAEHKKVEMPPPVVPAFCGGMSDNTEVVLKGCVVRDNRVFVKGKLVRPLNSIERDTINKLLTSRSALANPHHVLFFQRKKRETETKNEKSEKTLKQAQNDVAELLQQFLKVNATVAKRFLPVAKMSPLLNELSEEAIKVAENQQGDHEVHPREVRTAPESNFQNYNFHSQPFQVPTFSSNVPEQPFQQQLPELTPMPVFANAPTNEPDLFFGANAFHSLPVAQTTNNNQFFGPSNTVPIMVNNEPQQTSSYVFNGPDGQPIEIRGNIRPGDRMTIGGKSYVAVTINDLNPSQLSQLGNVLGNYQPGVIQNQGNTNYGSFVGTSNIPVQNTWQPNNFVPFQSNQQQNSAFGQNFGSQLKVRYHPGKGPEILSSTSAPALSQETLNAGMTIINQMPHQICTAHIANPFWFLQK